MATVFNYTTHFIGEIKFTNGFNCLLAFKANQDEAVSRRNKIKKETLKTLKPKMIADGIKPSVKNIYHYYNTPEYIEFDKKMMSIADDLKLDNTAYKKFEIELKECGQW